MNIDKYETIKFELLRKISIKPNFNQRKLAHELGYSLGKLNYCLNALKDKGLIKVKKFKNNKNKFKYLYILTPKGISEKSTKTINFMRLKAQEYHELKSEFNNQKHKKIDESLL